MNGLCSICARRVGARRLRRKRKASAGAERTSIGAAKERAHAGGAVGQVFASLGNRIHEVSARRLKAQGPAQKLHSRTDLATAVIVTVPRNNLAKHLEAAARQPCPAVGSGAGHHVEKHRL